MTDALINLARECGAQAMGYPHGNALLITPDQLATFASRLSEQASRAAQPTDAMRKALKMAVQQNSCDMLMTGEEIRQCEAALAGIPAPAESEPDASFNANAVAWAVRRWQAEVSLRPVVNVHRRSLDDTWRQVVRHFGGDPEKLLGPSHDEMRAKITPKEWEAMNAESEPKAESAYTGVRCECLLTGCRAGPGCPHYDKHCREHIAHERAALAKGQS